MTYLIVIVASLSLDTWFPGEVPTIIEACRANGIGEADDELEAIVFAIRKAENGRSGLEFGVLHPRCLALIKAHPERSLRIQAGWAAATVRKNYDRWCLAGRQGEFIVFLGNRYCPVGADNDPMGLNKHWIANVTYWSRKISGKAEEESEGGGGEDDEAAGIRRIGRADSGEGRRGGVGSNWSTANTEQGNRRTAGCHTYQVGFTPPHLADMVVSPGGGAFLPIPTIKSFL